MLNSIVFSQQNFILTFSNDSIKTVKKNLKKSFPDSLSLVSYIRDVRLEAIQQGHLLASVDSLFWKQQSCVVKLFLGPKFKTITLKNSLKTSPELKTPVKFNERILRNIPFTPSQISNLIIETENLYLNNGFPFCSVRLKDIQYEPKSLVSGILEIIPGEQFRIIKITIKGDSSISKTFITSLISVHEKDLFDESKLKEISGKIRQINFLKELKPHELLFTKEGCELFLYLKSNPLSSANGTVGLQPNPATNRVGLAGELNLKLLNILKHGEQLNLNWRSIQSQTQSMQLKVNYPFLFNSPFGIDAQLQLYKKDSSFLEVKSMLGVQYFLNSGSYLKAFYQQSSNNLLSGAATNPNFQKLSNSQTNAYGLSLFKRNLDYIPNPSKGWTLVLESAIGTRKTKSTDSSLTVRSTTCRVLFHTEWFLPVAKRHVVRFASFNEFYYAPVVYQNELFRFGGQMSLRGFNEDELYASSRSVTTLEYRYLLDRNSNLFVFYDQGYFENSSATYRKDHPYGFGGGLSFGTNLGIFSLSYALGSQQGNPILMKNGKIHFGYIAYF